MEATPEASAQLENLRDLQSQSLRSVVLFVAPLAYLWLIWVIWPITGGDSAVAWIGCLLLASGTVASYVLQGRDLRLASGLLVGSTLSAAICALLAFQQADLAYLLILPVAFASVLLGQEAILPLTVLAIVFGGVAVTRGLGLPLSAPDAWLPLIVIVLIAVALWLVAHNLYTTLGWVWSGYEQAHRNERLARQPSAHM